MQTIARGNGTLEAPASTDGSVEFQREQFLLKTGALQEAIFSSAYFSSILTDEKGVIQVFNVGAERMLGYAAADVVDRITPAEICDPQELVARATALGAELGTPIAPGFEALVSKASRGVEDIYELTYLRKDGSPFPAVVSVTALRDAQERILGYLLIGTDNTARKQVEAAQVLMDQRQRDQQFYTRSLIESSIDALMTTDPQGIITDVNQQMVALTGRTRDELIGAPCRSFFTDPVRADAAIRRVLTENKVSNYELTVRARDGSQTVVSYNAATFHDRDRKLQGVFAAARDVTNRKQFERTLQKKNLELEHASRMKSEFLATMSHELRTPLNAIIGFSEALKDGLMGQLSATQLECIGNIYTSGEHLLSLINDILDLSKVEAGKMALELESVDIAELLANCLSIVRDRATSQRIQLDLYIGDDVGSALLDLRKTRQIVYNLLSNAVKFSAAGGHVGLRARRVARSEVGTFAGEWPVHGFVLAAGEIEYEEFLEICVSDSGIGISGANMQRLFRSFSQVDSGLSRRFEGTGLGLAMVKQLAELHGGTVSVTSAEGRGARFAVWLPLRSPAPVADELPRDAAPYAVAMPGATRARVALVVEDDHEVANLVRVLLEAEGFSVIRAASGADALLLAGRQALGLVVLDIHMPGLDGWEFLDQIRTNGLLDGVPVVVIAGQADGNMALNDGAAAVLQKPVSRTQLKAALLGIGLGDARAGAPTVLVVDDDPKAVEAIAAFLPAPDYIVVRAYGGSEAVSVARLLSPDLIVLDLVMPQMSGFEVVDALRQDILTSRIPILVLSAHKLTSEERAELVGDPAKAVDVLERSDFHRVGLVAEIERVLARP